MDEFIYIGKIVNTHGIKGELRILSNFEKKELVFLVGNNLYIGNNYEEKKITSYRCHKEYDMVIFEGINNINEVIQYKKSPVYFKRNDLLLKEDDYLYNDLIGFSVIDDDVLLGKVNEISYNNSNILLCISGDKDFYLPLNSNYIKCINKKENIIETRDAKDLIL